MKYMFAQTAECSIKCASGSDLLKQLPEVIYKFSKWEYLCEETESGCFLKPTFRNMPYGNSFVPAIDVVISHNDDRTILHMKGQPVKSVRIFMTIWFSFALIMEILILVIAAVSKLDSLIPFFIPAGFCVYGYFLCKIGTQITFNSVVKAIQKKFS